MPDTKGSVTKLADQLRADDPIVREEAAAKLWLHYCPQILDLACRNIGARLRPRVDGDDVLQSVFVSFFARQQRGEFDLKNRDDLLGLLIRMTQNKARGASRLHARRKRDFRRDQAGGGTEESSLDAFAGLAQEGPTPEQAAAFAEEVERRLAELPAELRQIALWKLEGLTNEEIAARPEMDFAVRTVGRKLQLIREFWGVGSGPDSHL